MHENRKVSQIQVMCDLYSVSRSGYYAWRDRQPARRTIENRKLLDRIEQLFRSSDETYGSPRIHGVLRNQGERVNEKRVARLMRHHGLKARSAKIYRSNPGHHAFFASFPNQTLDTLAAAPNQVWVGDVTYLKVSQQFRYLAVVMDKYSRRIVGWAWSKDRNANLTLKAINRAVQSRRPKPGLVFHSDRGVEYCAHAYRKRLARLGIVQSMNRPRRMNDNAFMESFFHSFKSDKYHGVKFRSVDALFAVVRKYLPYYNERRAHSSLGYLSPVAYEQAN